MKRPIGPDLVGFDMGKWLKIIAIVVAVLALMIWLVPSRVLFWIFAVPGGIILFLLLIIVVFLLGRVKYRIDAHIGDDTSVYVDVRYLMRLFRCVAVYKDGKFDTRTRIAWKRLESDKPQQEEEEKKMTSADIEQAITSAITSAEKIYSKSDEADLNEEPEPTPEIIQEATTEQEPGPEQEPEPEPSTPEPKKTLKERINSLKQLKDVLTSLDIKTIIGLCFQALQKFVRALRPKRLDIYGVIGFDDPCTTGWVMGAYESAMGVLNLGPNVRVYGSYHEKAMRLDIKAKGRTRMFRLLWPFVWLYLRKPIRVVIHEHIL